jgi:hypothetical protein
MRLLHGRRKPLHPRQAPQDSSTVSRAMRRRLTGFVSPLEARARSFSATHAITDDVRSASGRVLAASCKTPVNKVKCCGDGDLNWAAIMAFYSMKIIGCMLVTT